MKSSNSTSKSIFFYKVPFYLFNTKNFAFSHNTNMKSPKTKNLMILTSKKGIEYVNTWFIFFQHTIESVFK